MNHSPAADPFRLHGGRLAAAAAYFDDAPTPWIDLSTGISPWAYPVADIDPSVLTRLPEPEQLEQLEASAAIAFGVDNAMEVVAVPGSDMAIRLLGKLYSKQRCAMQTPIYSGHKTAWPNAVGINISDMKANADDYDLLILANPNNPDGHIIAPEQLRKFRGQVIVDEAFADTDPTTSLLPNRGNAIVLRSFGKFYGLAGIRLGFVIADMPTAQRIRDLLGDWPVSGVALQAGTAAYRDNKWQNDQCRRLKTAADRMDRLLKNAGLDIVGGSSLFRLAAHDRALELFEILGQSGILARPFSGNIDQLRFGLPANEPAWQRLEKALNDWRNAL